MDRGPGADRSAWGREFYPPAKPRRRQAPPGQHPVGHPVVRGRRGGSRRTGALRRGRFPRRHGTGRPAHRGRAHRSGHSAPPRANHLRMAAAARQLRPQGGSPRHGAAQPGARGDRAVRPRRFGTSQGILRHAALCPPSGAHRRTGRLVHRGRHPHGRPAREAATGLRRGRRGLRPDGIAPDGLPAHDQNPVERLDGIQHHAAQSGTPEPARALLRLGMGVPALGGRLHAVGKHRLPAAARLLPRHGCSSSAPATAASN